MIYITSRPPCTRLQRCPRNDNASQDQQKLLSSEYEVPPHVKPLQVAPLNPGESNAELHLPCLVQYAAQSQE